jgi:hypothetical protein
MEEKILKWVGAQWVRRVMFLETPIFVSVDMVAIAPIDLRVRLQVLHLPLQLVRSEQVIGVEKIDKFAAGLIESSVSCRANARVMLAQVAYAIIPGREFRDDRPRIIR